jgi:hypothetical protein
MPGGAVRGVDESHGGVRAMSGGERAFARERW